MRKVSRKSFLFQMDLIYEDFVPQRYVTQKISVMLKQESSEKNMKKISRVIVSFLCRHMAQHGSSDSLCRICKGVFVSQAFLDQHFLDVHPTKSPHHCNNCNEDFISELFLEIHNTEYHNMPAVQNKEDSDESVKIEQANSPRSYNSRGFLKIKLQERNLASSSKTVNNSGYLQEKVISLAETVDNPFWCPVCLESYDERQNLRAHFLSNHIVCFNSKYICEICDVEKTSAETLCWHLEVHSNNKLSVNRFSKLRTQSVSVIKQGTEILKLSPLSTPNLPNENTSKNNQSKFPLVKREDSCAHTVKSNVDEISSCNSTKPSRLLSRFKQSKGFKSKVMSKLRTRSKRLSSVALTKQRCSSVISELKKDCNTILTNNKKVKKYLKGKCKNFKTTTAEQFFISNEDYKSAVKDCEPTNVSDNVAESLSIESCRKDFLIEGSPNSITSESGTIKNQDDQLKSTRSRSKAIPQLSSSEKNSDTCDNLETITLPKILSEKNSENKLHDKESNNCSSTSQNQSQEVNIPKNDKISVSKLPSQKLEKSYTINTRKSKRNLINIGNSQVYNGKVDSLHDILENPVNDKIVPADVVDKSKLKYSVTISNERSLNEEAIEDTSSSDSSVDQNNIDVGKINQDISINKETGSETVQLTDLDSNKSHTKLNSFLESLPKRNNSHTMHEMSSSCETVSSKNYLCDSHVPLSQSLTSKVVCEELLKEKGKEKPNRSTILELTQEIDIENTLVEKKQNSLSATGELDPSNIVDLAKEKINNKNYKISREVKGISDKIAYSTSMCDKVAQGSIRPINIDENLRHKEEEILKLVSAVNLTDHSPSKIYESYSGKENVECINESQAPKSKDVESTESSSLTTSEETNKNTNSPEPISTIKDNKIHVTLSSVNRLKCNSDASARRVKCSKNTESSSSPTISEQVLLNDKEQNSTICSYKVIKSTEELKVANVHERYSPVESVECKTDPKATRFEENTERSISPITEKETCLNNINLREDLKDTKANERLSSLENVECETDTRATKCKKEESLESCSSLKTQEKSSIGGKKPNSQKFKNVITLRKSKKITKIGDRYSFAKSIECETDSTVTRSKCKETPEGSSSSTIGEKSRCENTNSRGGQKCSTTDVSCSSAEHLDKAEFVGLRSKLDASAEESKSPFNESFGEIGCDKCPLKFYNQDDLFDHIATHYGL